MRRWHVIFLSLALLAVGCDEQSQSDRAAERMTGGSVERGRELLDRYGCVSCHTIPGVRNATGLVGPVLDKIAVRTYIAGVLVNRPSNMLRWLEDPPAVDPLTAMPNLKINEQDRRDLAAFLYTLK